MEVAKDATVGPRDVSVAGRVPRRPLPWFTTRSTSSRCAAGRHGARGRRRLPEAAAAVRGDRLSQRAGRQARHQGRLDLGPVDVDVDRSRNTPRRSTTTTRSSSARSTRNGLFTPNVDGPNPKRSGNAQQRRRRVGGGDLQDAARSAETPLRARAHLLVTVPLYMQWDQPEVANDALRLANTTLRGGRPRVPLSGAERGGVRNWTTLRRR